MRSFLVATVGIALGAVACAGTVAAPGGAAESGGPHASTQPTAVAEILRRVNERYASAATYSDQGTFRNIMRRPNGETSTTTGTIRTRWQKPDRLFFELSEKDDYSAHQLAMWTAAEGTKGWFLGRVEDHDSLSDALYAYQGVSHTLTALVPRWLLSNGCHFAVDYVLEGDSACGSSTCFVLSGKVPRRALTLMIDRDTYALRRYRTVYTIVPDTAELQKRAADHAAELSASERAEFLARAAEPFEVDNTFDYVPVFDAPLSVNAFDFTPPAPARTPTEPHGD